MYNNEDILIFGLMPYVHESLMSSSDVDSTSSVNDKSLITSLTNTLFPWIQNMTPGKYKAKIDNNVSEFTHSNWAINLIIQVLNIRVNFNRFTI